MEEVGSQGGGTVACPHCGGGIKPAAKICKHCRRSVERAGDIAPPRPPETASPLSPVLYELGVFLGGKKDLVNPAIVVEVLESRDSDDASALIRRLAAAGAVTSVQADALIHEFFERQMAAARRAIDVARARGLIPPTHAEQALASYSPMAFTMPINDHLVGVGLLTSQQVTQLSGSQIVRKRRWLFAVGVLVLTLVVTVTVVAARKGHAPQFEPPDDWQDHGIRRDGSKYLVASFRLVDKEGHPTAADGRLYVALPRCISSVAVKASEFMPYRKGLLWGRKHIDVGPGCQGGESLAGTKIIMRFVQEKTEKTFTVQNYGVSFDSPPEDLPAANAGSVLVSE